MDSMRGEGEELVFLYQLVDGCATCSHACHVAALAGLPQEIISRGREVTTTTHTVSTQRLSKWFGIPLLICGGQHFPDSLKRHTLDLDL